MFVSVAGRSMVRRLINVEVLERHNEVAGFIYAVIGVVYAVLLGFAAVTVWEGYDKAQAAVEHEADDLANLFRTRKPFLATLEPKSKIKSVTMWGLWSRKSGRRWLNAGRAQNRPRMCISSFGRATINSNPKTISNALGTRIR